MRGDLSREAQSAVATTRGSVIGTDPVPRSATPMPMRWAGGQPRQERTIADSVLIASVTTVDVDAATQTMIDNLPAKTGKPLDEWFAVLDAAGLDKHGQAVVFLKTEHGMSHGFANLVVTLHRRRSAGTSSDADLVAAQYTGAKAALRPICDRLLAEAEALGADVEVAPKKTGVSLRRSKQFALVEAPSAKRIQLGLNLRGVAATERLRSMNGMCTHRVDLTSVNDVDDEVQGWLRAAYDLA